MPKQKYWVCGSADDSELAVFKDTDENRRRQYDVAKSVNASDPWDAVAEAQRQFIVARAADPAQVQDCPALSEEPPLAAAGYYTVRLTRFGTIVSLEKKPASEPLADDPTTNLYHVWADSVVGAAELARIKWAAERLRSHEPSARPEVLGDRPVLFSERRQLGALLGLNCPTVQQLGDAIRELRDAHSRQIHHAKLELNWGEWLFGDEPGEDAAFVSGWNYRLRTGPCPEAPTGRDYYPGSQNKRVSWERGWSAANAVQNLLTADGKSEDRRAAYLNTQSLDIRSNDKSSPPTYAVPPPCQPEPPTSTPTRGVRANITRSAETLVQCFSKLCRSCAARMSRARLPRNLCHDTTKSDL